MSWLCLQKFFSGFSEPLLVMCGFSSLVVLVYISSRQFCLPVSCVSVGLDPVAIMISVVVCLSFLLSSYNLTVHCLCGFITWIGNALNRSMCAGGCFCYCEKLGRLHVQAVCFDLQRICSFCRSDRLVFAGAGAGHSRLQHCSRQLGHIFDVSPHSHFTPLMAPFNLLKMISNWSKTSKMKKKRGTIMQIRLEPKFFISLQSYF